MTHSLTHMNAHTQSAVIHDALLMFVLPFSSAEQKEKWLALLKRYTSFMCQQSIVFTVCVRERVILTGTISFPVI